ncbi:hypothetical protein DM806_18225 [Sphingobium lactosutens]|uniref:nucleotide synthetase n=1 Tax=Sphingobium lactosutens TaxID=522773 RepID=UPI0015BB675C|nr:nucleotide synthetase [Sphingobium lactosutens]NWK97566.1 hypothetical protein [Sphingobium lactosutens]
MSTLNYTQYGLAPLAPVELCDGAKPICFNVIFKAENEKIALRYEQPDAPGCPYIAITQDSLVEIVLVGDQIYFSKDLEGITTKESLASFYGGVEYDDYDEKLDRYKTLRFRARYNRGGKYGTRHGFNINIDLLQQTAAGDFQWIALSIDPDIRNPPPKQD